MIAQAKIGSGKTIAFLISMLLHVNSEEKVLLTICLCHTRELVMQTFELFEKMNKYTKFEGDIYVKNVEENEKQPSKTAQLLFGTSSSIDYFITKGEIDVSHVNFLVVDEADLLLDRKIPLFPPTAKLMNKLLP